MLPGEVKALRYEGPVVWVLPYLETGGTEHHVLYLLQAVRWAVRPIVLGPPGPLGPVLEAAGARVRYFENPTGNWWRGLRSYRHGLRDALLSVEKDAQGDRHLLRPVVHVHGAAELAWLAAGPARRAGAAMLFTAHGYFGSGAGWSYRLGARLLRSTGIPVIAVSKNEAARWLKAGLGRQQIVVVHNGVPDSASLTGGPTSLLGTDEKSGRAHRLAGLGLPAPGSGVVVGTAARLEPQKGIGVLLEALRTVTPVHPRLYCVVMGDGSERARLEARAREAGLEGHVFFTGRLAGAAHWFSGLDIFCLPSLDEALPLSLIEAMAAGCAVVATSVGGIPEVIRDGVDGLLVPPGNPQALAGALSRLVSDPALRARMQRAARARYEQDFTAGRMAALTLDVYRKLSDTAFGAAPDTTGSRTAGEGPSRR